MALPITPTTNKSTSTPTSAWFARAYTSPTPATALRFMSNEHIFHAGHEEEEEEKVEEEEEEEAGDETLTDSIIRE